MGFSVKILTNEFPCIYSSLKYRVCLKFNKTGALGLALVLG